MNSKIMKKVNINYLLKVMFFSAMVFITVSLAAAVFIKGGYYGPLAFCSGTSIFMIDNKFIFKVRKSIVAAILWAIGFYFLYQVY